MTFPNPGTPESKEAVASKITKKLLEQYKDNAMLFIISSEERDLYEAELVKEFGEYDPRIVAEYFNSKKENLDDIKDEEEKEFFKRLADWDAEGHHEAQCVESFVFFFEPATIRLNGLLAKVKEAHTLPERVEAVKTLKEELGKLLEKRKYNATVYSRGSEKEFILTMETLFRYFNDMLNTSISGYGSTSGAFREYVEIIIKNENEFAIQERVGHFDLENFEKEKEVYGAKGAFLGVIDKLKEDDYFRDMLVADFLRIPTDIFTKWKNGESILNDLLPFYDEFIKTHKDQKVIVRSSAVYSEDNENSTGAGIYKSIVLSPNASRMDFVKAVLEIYKSVDSEMAVKYREEKSISQEEKMGIVIQKHVDSSEETKGYVNSVMHNVPELLDIVYENGLRPAIVKSQLAEMVDLHDARNIFHYQFDLNRKFTHLIEELASLTLKLERYFGFPIQIEFIEGDREEDFGTFILQVRFLPKDFSKKIDIRFPEGLETIYEGRGLGALDMELNVLDNSADNSENEGVVIFEKSKFTTTGFEDRVMRSLPKSGAVVVLGGSRSEGGHIETICAEKGVAVIFSDHIDYSSDRMLMAGLSNERVGMSRVSNLQGFTKVRVVSNGLEGKIYGLSK